jgi:hypothetical protein
MNYNRVVVLDLGKIAKSIRSNAAEHGIDLARLTPPAAKLQ